MYTLHTINHMTGEEQIREFNNCTEACKQWEKERHQIKEYYGSLGNYHANRKITHVGDNLTLHSNYQDMYLEKCEE